MPLINLSNTDIFSSSNTGIWTQGSWVSGSTYAATMLLNFIVWVVAGIFIFEKLLASQVRLYLKSCLTIFCDRQINQKEKKSFRPTFLSPPHRRRMPRLLVIMTFVLRTFFYSGSLNSDETPLQIDKILNDQPELTNRLDIWKYFVEQSEQGYSYQGSAIRRPV